MSGTLAASTPTNRRLAGTTVAVVDGITYQLTEFSWSPGNVKRETLTSFSGVDGYSENPRAPYIAGKFRDSQQVSVSSFTGKTSSTVTLILANGKSIEGHNLWQVGDVETAGADATFDFRFEGVQGSITEG